MKQIEGWEVKREGGQTVLYSTHGEHDGIDIVVNKGRKSITVGGWYDSCVGIPSTELLLDDLIKLFTKETKGNGGVC